MDLTWHHYCAFAVMYVMTTWKRLKKKASKLKKAAACLETE